MLPRRRHAIGVLQRVGGGSGGFRSTWSRMFQRVWPGPRQGFCEWFATGPRANLGRPVPVVAICRPPRCRCLGRQMAKFEASIAINTKLPMVPVMQDLADGMQIYRQYCGMINSSSPDHKPAWQSGQRSAVGDALWQRFCVVT